MISSVKTQPRRRFVTRCATTGLAMRTCSLDREERARPVRRASWPRRSTVESSALTVNHAAGATRVWPSGTARSWMSSNSMPLRTTRYQMFVTCSKVYTESHRGQRSARCTSSTKSTCSRPLRRMRSSRRWRSLQNMRSSCWRPPTRRRSCQRSGHEHSIFPLRWCPQDC